MIQERRLGTGTAAGSILGGPVGTAYREVAALFPGRPVLARVAASDLGFQLGTILDVALLRADMGLELAILMDRPEAEVEAARRALPECPLLAVRGEDVVRDPMGALHEPLARLVLGMEADEADAAGAPALLEHGDRHPRSGLAELDRRLGPMEPGDLLLLGGLTGMGKSSFLRHLAVENAVRRAIPTLYLTLEASHERAAMDMALAELRMDGSRLQAAGASPEERTRLEATLARLRSAPLTLASRPDMTPDAVEALVRCQATGAERVRLVLVDCLELVAGDAPDLLPRLKRLARRSEAAIVVATNSITTARVSRPDGRPALPDLGELGAHADKVLLLHRERVYEMRGDNAYIAEVLVAKNRSGPKGLATVAYFEESRSFADLEVTYDATLA